MSEVVPATLRRPAGNETPGFVLHWYAYSETSMIVEVFTRDAGRVPLVAKGARRPRGSVLVQFQPYDFSWSGKGDLKTLRKAEWQGGMLPLPPSRLFCGFYLNELLMKLLAREDPHEQLFDAYAKSIGQLASGAEEGPVLREFEKALLKETGFALVLTREAQTLRPVVAEHAYVFVPDEGVRRWDGRDTGGEAGGVVLEGKILIDIDQGNYAEPRTAQVAKQLMRRLLDRQLNGRTLATRQILSQMLGT